MSSFFFFCLHKNGTCHLISGYCNSNVSPPPPKRRHYICHQQKSGVYAKTKNANVASVAPPYARIGWRQKSSVYVKTQLSDPTVTVVFTTKAVRLILRVRQNNCRKNALKVNYFCLYVFLETTTTITPTENCPVSTDSMIINICTGDEINGVQLMNGMVLQILGNLNLETTLTLDISNLSLSIAGNSNTITCEGNQEKKNLVV